MNRDGFRGGTRHLKGRANTALGGLTGDPARQVRGAVDQVAGGAQYAYGRARERTEDLVEEGTDLAHDGSRYARDARRRGTRFGRDALGYADDHRSSTLLAVAVVAFGVGWLTRSPR